MNLRCILPLVLLSTSGCLVTRSNFEAEVARTRALEHGIEACEKRYGVLEQRNRDLLKSGVKLKLERSSLDQERIELLDSLEKLREGNEQISLDLALERRIREQKEAELEEVAGTYTSVVEELESELQAGQLEIQTLRNGIQLRASDEILFASGSAIVKPIGREVLTAVARQIVNLSGHRTRVEGHTDDVPIATQEFPSNWDLSADRAIGVVRFLVEQGVDPAKISASGFGEFSPIESNDTDEGRARNRRIEILLVPEGER